MFDIDGDSLESPGKVSYLLHQIEKRLESYRLCFIPTDATETPIRGWKTDIFDNQIKNTPAAKEDGRRLRRTAHDSDDGTPNVLYKSLEQS